MSIAAAAAATAVAVGTAFYAGMKMGKCAAQPCKPAVTACVPGTLSAGALSLEPGTVTSPRSAAVMQLDGVNPAGVVKRTPNFGPAREAHAAAADAMPDIEAEMGNDAVVTSNEYNHRRFSIDASGCIIVGVGGASGSGKTSIATLIQQAVPLTRVESISCDNYYKPLPPGTPAETYNFDHPDAIDFQLLHTHLQALKRGEPVDLPVYDFTTHKRRAETIRIENANVVILDGIFTLYKESIRDVCDVTMFTHEDLDVCLARRLRRDIVERARSVDSVLQQYQKFVKPGYEMFVRPSMQHADLIIPRARENHTAILLLARDILQRVRVNAGDDIAQQWAAEQEAMSRALTSSPLLPPPEALVG